MERQRVLAVKLELNLRNADDKAVWQRLRELSWQAMQYGNNHLRSVWAEARGLRIDPAKGDPHDLTKHVRRFEKGELSGAAYSAIEREAKGLWRLHGKRVLAGAPLPEFREGKSLAIRGHAKNLSESGVRLTFEGGQFFAHLQAQAATCADGCWLKIPIAKNTATDEYQAPLLHRMAAWEMPIRKGTITLAKEAGRAILRLSFAEDIELPPMGSRQATIGPLTRHGDRLLLRTELETKDFSSRLARIAEMKRQWEPLQRRVRTQIGRRRGASRKKRIVLARMSLADWLKTYMHQWSFELIDWCASQGVGRLTVLPIGNADWPAFEFVSMLKYKGASRSIDVVKAEEAELTVPTERAAKQEVSRQKRRAKKINEAVREIAYHIGEVRDGPGIENTVGSCGACGRAVGQGHEHICRCGAGPKPDSRESRDHP